MRRACLDAVYELAKTDDRIVFIGSDLGAGTLKRFREEMPNRFFMEGISEAHIIGMAAGMALEGKIVYVNTIATFITRRCFEQDVLDLGLHRAKVRLIGSGGGLVYAPLGPTHLAVDDIAIMKTIPDMAVVVPADAEEMKRLMSLTVEYDGPMYISVAKGGDPVVTPRDECFEIGKAVGIKKGKDALIVTTGICLGMALDASRILEKDKLKVGILHIPTIKPLDVQALKVWCGQADVVISVEERSVVGGLGSSVAEVIAESAYSPGKPFVRIGLPDEFLEGYGSQGEMMERYGLTPERIAKEIRRLRCLRK